MGKKGVNLQDTRYSFRTQILGAIREYARRAMRAQVAKSVHQHDIDRMRNTVNLLFSPSNIMFILFLHCFIL